MATRKVVPLKKLNVRVEADSFSGYDLEGSLSDLALTVERLIAEHGPEAHLDWCSQGYQAYTDTPGYVLYKDRPETDEEWAERTATERKRLADMEARDRKEYERLKKKFDGKV